MMSENKNKNKKSIALVGTIGIILDIVGLAGALIMNFHTIRDEVLLTGTALNICIAFELMLVIGVVLTVIAIFRILKKIEELT
jgi:hypothetical protein